MVVRTAVAIAIGLVGGAGAVALARRYSPGRTISGPLWIALCGAACGLMAAAVDDLRLAVLVWMAIAGTALSAIDAATTRLPNAVLYPSGFVGAALVLVVSLARGRTEEIVAAVVGAIAGIVPVYAVWLMARSGGLGFGDVRFSGWLGMHLGVLHALRIVAGLLIGLIAGLVVTGALALLGRRNLREPFPLGPYLALGAVLSVPWGGALIGS